jgi:protein phosphatase
MRIAVFNRSGRAGRISQDAVFADIRSDDDGAIFSVADGLGGRPRGERASEIAQAIVKEIWEARSEFEGVFERITKTIQLEDRIEGSKGMGTTLSFGVANKDLMSVYHVGDCSILHLRNSGIKRLTSPQTEFEALVQQGVFERSFRERYHRKNVLTSALTSDGEYNVQKKTVGIQPFDRFLAVSDGVMNVMTLKDIRDLSVDSIDAEQLSGKIVTAIEARGPVDDYSGAILFI